eukprot:Em0004g715a
MSDSSKEVMEATNNFFEARVAVLGYKCRVLQLEGLLEASREENRKLVDEVQWLKEQLQGRNAGHYRPEIEVHEPSVACDGMSPSELEESILPPPILHPNQPLPMYGGYDSDQVQRDSALRRDQPFHDGGLANQLQSAVAIATYPQPRPRQGANGPSFPTSQPQWNGHNYQVMGSCPICGLNNFRSVGELEMHSARCTDFTS